MARNDVIGASTRAYLPEFEWDGLQSPYEINTVDPSTSSPSGVDKIRIWRDDAYKIHGEARGIGFSRLPRRSPAGSFARGVTVTGSETLTEAEQTEEGELREIKHILRTYALPDCHIDSASNGGPTGEVPTFAFNLSPWRVSRAIHPLREAVRLTEWYLNGPHQHAGATVFPRTMRRELAQEYKRRGLGDNGPNYPAIILSQGEAIGYASITYGDKRFLLYQVPQGCGPEWSHNMGIEFRAEWGGIPTVDDREAIGEIVSFLVGRRLVHVGYTGFDAEGLPVEEVSFNPWGDNVVALCDTPGRPPVKLDPWTDRLRLETALAQLVPPYLDVRDALGLKNALWHYWLSNESPPGIDLTIISAALDRVSDKWLKSNKSKVQGVYLPKKEFDTLTTEEFAQIEAKLARVEGREFVMGTLRKAFEIRGVVVKRNTFLKEIKLPIGPVEEAAFRARGGAAHGGGVVSEQEHRSIIRYGDAYRTAFARVVLKILGYTGSYADYSAPDFPETPLDQPQAGWLDERVEDMIAVEDEQDD